MSYDILSILEEKKSTFSKGQKRIAAYITEAYDKAAFMTANRLGKTVGVSESTVVRFAVDLGFDGYPSMQKAMREMVLNRLTSVQRLEVASNRLGDQDVVSMVLHSDMEKLRQTSETVSREEFKAAVDAVLKAKRVYIMGVRSVAPLANFLGYYLNYMFNNVHVISGSSAGEMFERIVGVNSDDVVIAFSYLRTNYCLFREHVGSGYYLPGYKWIRLLSVLQSHRGLPVMSMIVWFNDYSISYFLSL